MSKVSCMETVALTNINFPLFVKKQNRTSHSAFFSFSPIIHFHLHANYLSSFVCFRLNEGGRQAFVNRNFTESDPLSSDQRI